MLREKLQRTKSSLKKNWRFYRRNRLGMAGLGILVFFAVLAVFADYIAPYDPLAHESWWVGPALAPPSWITLFIPTIPVEETFGIFGTDEMGRDIFSMIVYGTRVSLFIGLCSALVVNLIGLAVGIFSGYFGGKTDTVLMRITDMVLVMPFIPLLIVLAAIVGPSLINMVLLFGVVGWAFTARLVRSQVVKEKERTYIEVARGLGGKDSYIMRRHILPNVTPLLFANAVAVAASFVMAEASLSFIGLGDPNHISWGMVIYYALQNKAPLLGAWWYVVPPGICITLMVLSLIFIGQALDDILNPRLRKRR